MKVFLVGGGSGGHITPPLAVAHRLKTTNRDIEIHYVIEAGSKFADLVRDNKDLDEIHVIRAGKFRRYHGESFVSHVLGVKTNLKNIRDFFNFLIGIAQSFFLLRRERPDTIFIKGGFVGVPIGIVAGWLHIPYLTHDSDTVPGLANRFIGNKAALHTVGMPVEFYNYPKEKTRYVGIPVSSKYQKVSNDDKKRYMNELGLSKANKVLCITGGSLGAERLNTLMKDIVPALLDEHQELHVFHQTGEKNKELYSLLSDEQKRRIIELPFADNLYAYTGAADLVIARAGATTIAELALQQKPTLLVPNPNLTGGHQTKNALHLDKQNAVGVLTEEELKNTDTASQKISAILSNKSQLDTMAQNLAKLAKPDAAKEIADAVLEVGRGAKD